MLLSRDLTGGQANEENQAIRISIPSDAASFECVQNQRVDDVGHAGESSISSVRTT